MGIEESNHKWFLYYILLFPMKSLILHNEVSIPFELVQIYCITIYRPCTLMCIKRALRQSFTPLFSI